MPETSDTESHMLQPSLSPAADPDVDTEPWRNNRVVNIMEATHYRMIDLETGEIRRLVLDLEKLSRVVNVVVSTPRFQKITIQIDNPCIIALIFSSGNVVFGRALSLDDLAAANYHLLDLFNRHVEQPRYRVFFEHCNVTNVVSTFSLSERCDIGELARRAGIWNNTNIFPAICFRLGKDNSIRAIVFSTGAVNIIGPKNIAESMAAAREFCERRAELTGVPTTLDEAEGEVLDELGFV